MNTALALNPLQQLELQELKELYEVLGLEPDGTIFETGANGFEQPEVAGRFRINDLDQLNWAFRKLQALQEQQDKINQLAAAEFDRIKNWQAKELAGIQSTVEFFNQMAADYARRQREENPKYKGEKTPYGKISFRKQQTEWKYTDEAALVQYLEDNGHVELVRTKKEPIKTELKKMLLVTETGAVVDPTTGEIVPSVTATERPDAVDIKVEG